MVIDMNYWTKVFRKLVLLILSFITIYLSFKLACFYMPFLIPLAIGLIVGIIAATKLLERAMDRHPQPTYLMILGFILGSIFNIFPGIPSLPQAPVCLLTFAAGFTAIYFLSKKEAQGTN